MHTDAATAASASPELSFLPATTTQQRTVAVPPILREKRERVSDAAARQNASSQVENATYSGKEAHEWAANPDPQREAQQPLAPAVELVLARTDPATAGWLKRDT